MSDTPSSLSEVVIIPFDPTDVLELARLAVLTAAHTYNNGYVMAGAELNAEVERGPWVQRFNEAAEVDTILVAKLGGVIVGYTQFGGQGRLEAALWPSSQELAKLYVAPEVQRRRIGSQLMDAALASPVLAPAPQVYLWVWGGNPRAITFYERYDFKAAAARYYGDSYDLCMLREQSAVPRASEE